MPRLEPEGNTAWIREHVAMIVGVVLFVSTVVVAASVFPRLLDGSAQGTDVPSSRVAPATPPTLNTAPASR